MYPSYVGWQSLGYVSVGLKLRDNSMVAVTTSPGCPYLRRGHRPSTSYWATPIVMGCQSSKSILSTVSISSHQQTKQQSRSSDDVAFVLELPSKELSSATQVYRSLVSTDANQRSELASLLRSWESSGVIQSIEQRVANIRGDWETITSLAAMLADLGKHYPQESKLHADVVKAYVAFVWIANNIEYDLEAWDNLLEDLPIPSTSPANVLVTRRSICSGYASLFSALASELSLESVVIDGHFKISRVQQSGGPRVEFFPSSFNTHAWNAVSVVL